MQVIKNAQYKATGLSPGKFVENKKFIDCTFEKCNMSEYRFTNCEFEDCHFVNCNFKKTFLALNNHNKAGKFLNCLFNNCNLTATSFRFPVIENCEFRNCVLKETNFDGSRFSDSRFIGTLDSCFFRGYSIYAGGSLFALSKFDPHKFPNPMMNVDFSQSKLVGVIFSHSIDLSHCIFPEGDNYIYISDLKKTMHCVIDQINSGWNNDKEKETGLNLIQQLYYNKDMQEQQNSFIDYYIQEELDQSEGNDLGRKLLDLIRSCNN